MLKDINSKYKGNDELVIFLTTIDKIKDLKE